MVTISSLPQITDQPTYPWAPQGHHPLQEPKSGRRGFRLSRRLGCGQIQSPGQGFVKGERVKVKREEKVTYWLILHVGRAEGEEDYSRKGSEWGDLRLHFFRFYSWIYFQTQDCEGKDTFKALKLYQWNQLGSVRRDRDSLGSVRREGTYLAV